MSLTVLCLMLAETLAPSGVARADTVPVVTPAKKTIDATLMTGLDEDLFGSRATPPRERKRTVQHEPEQDQQRRKVAEPSNQAAKSKVWTGAGRTGSTRPPATGVVAKRGAGLAAGGGSSYRALREIERQMRSAQTRLVAHADATGTERLQQAIIRELDALIGKCRRCQGVSKAGGGQSAQTGAGPPAARKQPANALRSATPKPVRRPSDQSGHHGASRPSAPAIEGLVGTTWGHLPGQMRQRLLQWTNERFLPKYETQIEQYFQRLTEPSTDRGPSTE